MDIYKRMATATQKLAADCNTLQFTGVANSVAHVYNPLDYAAKAHDTYLKRFGSSKKRVVFLGMNPGPYGMMQVGVPFGEVSFVRDWMGITEGVRAPPKEHPKRPIQGFDCQRSEVSGKRFWGWVQQRWQSPEAFFSECFVLNYCPLVFLEASGKNLTPDKLTLKERTDLEAICDEHLRSAVETLDPEWCIGIGAFAKKRLESALSSLPIGQAPMPKIAQILHPSPQSPQANRGWSQAVELTLAELRIFSNV
jgi:single-strand selective monofunctional uracil DNA glycosylase